MEGYYEKLSLIQQDTEKSNEKFYFDIVKKSKEISQLGNDQARERAYFFEMTEICQRLTDTIVKGAEWEIQKAANKGLTAAVIYRYGNGSWFMGKPTAFLINGPKDGGLTHFSSRGIKDVVTRLKKELPFFKIATKRGGSKSEIFNYIEVSWEQ